MSRYALAPGLGLELEGFESLLADGIADFLQVDVASAPCDAWLRLRAATVDGTGAGRLVEQTPLEIRELGGGWLFAAAGARACVARGVADVELGPASLASFVALILPPLLAELAAESSWLLVHAAAIAIDGRGLLLPGASGAGKTTIFHAAARAGLDLLSDDLVWVDAAGRLAPFRRGAPYPSVPKATVASAALAAIAIPGRSFAAASRIEPLAAAELLPLLAEQARSLEPVSPRRFARLVQLATYPACRLRVGDGAVDVAEALAAVVQTAPRDEDRPPARR